MVGDFVTYSGNLYKIDPGAPVTPFDPAKPVGAGNLPINQQFYISANTVQAEKLQVITAPGTVAEARSGLHHDVQVQDRHRRRQPDASAEPRSGDSRVASSRSSSRRGALRFADGSPMPRARGHLRDRRQPRPAM